MSNLKFENLRMTILNKPVSIPPHPPMTALCGKTNCKRVMLSWIAFCYPENYVANFWKQDRFLNHNIYGVVVDVFPAEACFRIFLSFSSNVSREENNFDEAEITLLKMY